MSILCVVMDLPWCQPLPLSLLTNPPDSVWLFIHSETIFAGCQLPSSKLQETQLLGAVCVGIRAELFFRWRGTGSGRHIYARASSSTLRNYPTPPKRKLRRGSDHRPITLKMCARIDPSFCFLEYRGPSVSKVAPSAPLARAHFLSLLGRKLLVLS